MDVIFSSLYHCHRFQVHFSGVVPAMTNQVSAGSQPLSRHNLPVVAIPNAATTIVISITHYRCHQADGEAPESLLLSSNILLPMQPMTDGSEQRRLLAVYRDSMMSHNNGNDSLPLS